MTSIATFPRMNPNRIPIKIPMIPPTRQSTTDSIRNCCLMALFLAPSAFRIPISFGSLGDGHQHDIHDADATNDQGNSRDKGNGHGYYINDRINNAHIRRHIVCCDLPFFIFRIFVCKKALNICFCLLLIRTCF